MTDTDLFDIESLAIELAESSRSEVGQAILVAGQAMAFWGSYYQIDDIVANGSEFLASGDIDFFDRRRQNIESYLDNIKKIIQKYGAYIKDVQYPTMDDSTFHTAILSLTVPGHEEPLLVDYIGHVDGLDDNVVLKGADTVKINEYEFKVLNPCLCLRARAHNLVFLYPKMGKSQSKIDIEKERVKLGLNIIQLHLIDLITRKDLRRAHYRAQIILKIAKTQLGKKLWRNYGINILEAIPKRGLDDRFYKYSYTDAYRKLIG